MVQVFMCQCPSCHPTSSVKELKALTLTGGLASTFLHLPTDSWQNGHYSLDTVSARQILLLPLHPFSSVFSRRTWVSRHQKGKPFWILMKQDMMGWQWHQLDHVQIICTSLQTDNHVSTSPLIFYRPDALPVAQPTASKHWRQLLVCMICVWLLYKDLAVSSFISLAVDSRINFLTHPSQPHQRLSS